jgi:predicted DNA-binding transcriptional regulator AlpA
MGRFNGFLKSVILRISEVKDLGEISRYEFYNHMKNLTAAPPDVLRVDEKNLREHSIINCTGIVYTTNHRTDSLYLTSDDRRHYVDWSELKQEDFAPGYWPELWGWFENGGYGHVAAYLRELDLSYFNPKAPPLKTPAFWDMVDAGRAPEDGELADLIDMAGNPKAFTINDIRPGAGNSEIGEWLDDRKNRRQIPHRLEACGYTSIRNDCAADGRWKIRGTRQTVYALAELSLHERLTAAKGLMEEAQKKADPFAGTGFHRYSSKSNNAFNKMGFESC